MLKSMMQKEINDRKDQTFLKDSNFVFNSVLNYCRSASRAISGSHTSNALSKLCNAITELREDRSNHGTDPLLFKI